MKFKQNIKNHGLQSSTKILKTMAYMVLVQLTKEDTFFVVVMAFLYGTASVL